MFPRRLSSARRRPPIALTLATLMMASACAGTTTITSMPAAADLAAASSTASRPDPASAVGQHERSGEQEQAVLPAAPADSDPTVEDAAPPAAAPTPESAITSPGTEALTGVVDIAVDGVRSVALDRNAFLTPRMQDRLDEMLRPDSLVEPNPESATLISGTRRVDGDSFTDDPQVVALDVRFFGWVHEVDDDASLEVVTPSYEPFAALVNQVELSIGPRNGGPNWIIQPAGQTPAERRARSGLPHLVDIDTALRPGAVYGLGRLLATNFRFAHRIDVIGPVVDAGDTLAPWVQVELDSLGPMPALDQMPITGWDASVGPDWISDQPLDERGVSRMQVTFGTASASLDNPGDAIVATFNQVGQAIADANSFSEVTFHEETTSSGSFTYQDDANDRSIRLYYSAGPTLEASYLTVAIDESTPPGF